MVRQSGGEPSFRGLAPASVEVVRIVFGDSLDQSIGVVPGVLVGAFVHTGDMSLLVYKICSA